ncbi:MAG: hypothetical protein ACT452_03295 [Microthrixaceae bacterium]
MPIPVRLMIGLIGLTFIALAVSCSLVAYSSWVGEPRVVFAAVCFVIAAGLALAAAIWCLRRAVTGEGSNGRNIGMAMTASDEKKAERLSAAVKWIAIISVLVGVMMAVILSRPTVVFAVSAAPVTLYIAQRRGRF